MSRKSHHPPEPETTETEPLAGAAAEAQLEPSPDGQPDPAGQAKISAAGGQHAAGDLVSELGALPAIGALDGIRANAQAGYYKTVPAEQLVADLEGLTFETEEQQAVHRALIERARGGSFSA